MPKLFPIKLPRVGIVRTFTDTGGNKLSTDKLQLSFFRHLMGVRETSSIIALRGELGLLPTYIEGIV